MRVDRTVLIAATIPKKMIGDDQAVEAVGAKWANLKTLAAENPEALKLELPVPDEYQDLLALLLVNSELQIQSRNIRFSAEVEIDLFLTTLLKVQAK